VGTSQADKEKHHDRIVAIAATRVRERGLDGIGVADLMKEAGLTHGGFYRHFGSREDLIDEAVERALGEGTKRVASGPKASEKHRFQTIVDGYLSIAHRNSPGSGCAVAALSSEAWRGGKRVRQAYTRQVKMYLALIEDVIDGRRRPPRGGATTRFDTGAFRAHWRRRDGAISRRRSALSRYPELHRRGVEIPDRAQLGSSETRGKINSR
jgi:TetR/AcrR family transcriptional repressor of nem operon